MRRFIAPAAMAVAFIALMSVSQAVKAVEVGDPIVVGIACSDRRTVEEHLALIEEDKTYNLARERLAEDMAVGKCIRVPSVPLRIEEKGREVRLVDSDGDNMELTVIRVADGVWTMAARILGKEG